MFYSGLSYDTNETVLKDAFGKHGEILEGDFFLILSHIIVIYVLLPILIC